MLSPSSRWPAGGSWPLIPRPPSPRSSRTSTSASTTWSSMHRVTTSLGSSRPSPPMWCRGCAPSWFEAVADARLSDQVPWMGWFGFELSPQLGHVHPQVVRLGAIGRTPDFLQKLLAGDQAPGVSSQDLQEVPLGWREPNLVVTAGDPFGGQVD